MIRVGEFEPYPKRTARRVEHPIEHGDLGFVHAAHRLERLRANATGHVLSFDRRHPDRPEIAQSWQFGSPAGQSGSLDADALQRILEQDLTEEP